MSSFDSSTDDVNGDVPTGSPLLRQNSEYAQHPKLTEAAVVNCDDF